MNVNEQKVYEAALESVGGLENYVLDNDPEETEHERNLTRDQVAKYAMVDAVAECPKECRFLGNERIWQICKKAADQYDYRTW